MRPVAGSYPDYYDNYIPLIRTGNIISALEENRLELISVLKKVDAEKENYAYQPGKWTVKQVVQHITDAERVFAYRALRFARLDPAQPLPFDENKYADVADVTHRDLADLLHELGSVRGATQCLFKTFSQETLLRTGNTSFGRTTVLAIGYLIAGHALHHLNVLKQRYL